MWTKIYESAIVQNRSILQMGFVLIIRKIWMSLLCFQGMLQSFKGMRDIGWLQVKGRFHSEFFVQVQLS